jgi:hypothetical protein
MICMAGCAPAQPLSTPATAPTPAETGEAAPASAPSLTGLDALPPNINPLTGLVLADPSLFNRRPLIVKISNAPVLVRPQAGIGAADWVFEHYVEGGLTRFSAVYLSQLPQRAGSVRSARLIDNALLPMVGGLFVFSGASDGVMAIIKNSDYAARTYIAVAYGLPYAWRDEASDAPHNLFVNPAAFDELARAEGLGQRPDLSGLAFGVQPPAGASGSARILEVSYRATRAGWVFDPTTSRYQRFSDGLPHTDANTGAQVTADNVVVLYAHHQDTDIVESQWQGVISWSIEIQLWGEGEALLLRDGQQYAARWQRPDSDAMLRLVTADGAPLSLRPGVTWFQVLPLRAELAAGVEGVRTG